MSEPSGRGSNPEILVDDTQVLEFRTAIRDHYRAKGRAFPWRETRDPYRILVSEFMLQQTQTERVIPKYEAWLARFPDAESLASAELRDALSMWSGLGYNRRARYLREACQAIVARHSGLVPSDPAALMELPGVGPYTASAVSTFAFGLPNAFIETNIRAVFLFFFFTGKDDVHDREIMPLVKKTIDLDDPRQWYYALMDYGAELKRVTVNPGRSSAHYAKQGKFNGSRREARGAVIRYLSGGMSASCSAISEAESIDPARILEALDSLIREGLVEELNGVYRV